MDETPRKGFCRILKLVRGGKEFSLYPSKFLVGVPVTKALNERKTQVY